MSGESPAAILYDSNGVALAVYNNTAIPASTPAILFAGSDGVNSQYAKMTNYGALFGTQASTNVVVQSAAVVTTSGSSIITTDFFGSQQINLIVNAGTVTGAGSIQYTIQEIDPGDGTTLFGNSASTVVINTGNAPGVFLATLPLTHSSAIKVTWTVTGTFSSTIYSTITTKSTPDTQTISGSITATNPSVGTDGAAVLGFDTQIGGSVTTAAPTYTTGNLNALSLTTLGGLRIDGVYASGTANATAADLMANGGYVTTAAPTYTTGQLSALSLTTAGALRIDGSGTTQPVSGTVTANQGTSPWVTSVSGTVAVTQSTSPWIVAGGGTAGTPASGVVTVQGISGMTALQVVTNKATTSSVTSVASSATNVTLLSANPNRLFASIYNSSSKTVYIKLGTTASSSSFSIFLMPNSYWEVPVDWTGQIDAIWTAANGNALITELTP